jgi:phosphoribosyl-dephospho-CoA transferase
MLVRIHDLLEIQAQSLLDANSSAPAWVAESLTAAPFVVVRRGLACAGEIAVGVRGGARNQRWAGCCAQSWIRRVISPTELVSGMRLASSGTPPPSVLLTLPGAPTPPYTPTPSRSSTIPALRSLAFLSHHESWRIRPHQWGPGGSVGFELATGCPTATPQSDLDVVIYADERLSVEEAKRLHAATRHLPCAVDVRVETPACGFSLAEYASRAPAPILLRTLSGAVLGVDPWGSCPNSAATISAAAALSAATPASYP